MKFFVRYKGLKITFIVLLLLVGGIYMSFDFFLERILIRDLSGLINKDSDNLYFYTFDDLDLILVEGSVTMTNIGVHPKLASFDSLKSKTNDLHVLVELEIGKVKLEGLEISKFIRTGELEMGVLQINTPAFKYYFNRSKKKSKTNKNASIGDIFSKNFKSAKLLALDLTKGNVEMREINEHQPNISIIGIDLKMEEAYADSISIRKFGLFDYKDIFLDAEGISIGVSEDITIVSEQLSMDVKDKSLRIQNFQVQPRLNRESFTDKFEFQKNWIALQIEELVIRGIDGSRFINHDGINIHSIEVRKPNLALYKDKTKELPPFKKKPMPASAIKLIPWSINVDSIIITEALITINEKSRITKSVSDLTFNAVNATVSGFTNVDSLAHALVLVADARPMNAARVTTEMRFDLTSKEDRFSVKGKLEQADATLFNGVLTPGLGVKILDGDIHALAFDFSGMDTLSRGTLDFKYENLKLEIINTDTTKKERRGFLTFAANSIVNENNTEDSYVEGIIHSDRDLGKGFFPFFWHSIQSGLISTLAPITNTKKKRRQHQEAKRKQ